MKRISYIYILILFFILLGTVLGVWLLSGDREPSLSPAVFRESLQDRVLEPYYEQEEDRFYLFLPSYAGLEDIRLSLPEQHTLTLGGREVTNGTLAGFEPDTDYALSLKKGSRELCAGTLRFLRCQNLPTMYIDTESGEKEALDRDKQARQDATVTLISADNRQEFMGIAQISGRGNTTWGYDKNPYNLRFESATSLFGFQSVDQYALVANYADESRLRNSLVYYAAREQGIAYTSDMAYFDLYIDGEYCGLYTACTKKYYEQGIPSGEVTGVFEYASPLIYEYKTDDGTPINFYYGDQTLLRDTIRRFEALLHSNAPYSDLCAVIDMDSFARKCILEEFFLDFDYYKSQYFYIDGQGIIHAANAWDYDLTMGKFYGYYLSEPADYLMFKHYRDIWYTDLYGYPEFRQRIRELFEEEFTEDFKAGLLRKLNEDAALIADSWEADRIRFQYSQPYTEGYGASDLTSFQENHDFLLDYVEKRYAFLSDYYENTFMDDVVLPPTDREPPAAEPSLWQTLTLSGATTAVVFGFGALLLLLIICTVLRREKGGAGHE